jgi:3D-(3,5/4)-trihydroxycyclohexane-1,2-dione acylhydrolase (decyclizing)
LDVRLTTAQAVVRFLAQQHVERDEVEHRFFAGVLGIFGHGNLAGVGQALQEYPDVRYVLSRNEQAMVHTAIGYAKMSNRLSTFACASSIGPGATNMVTGAADATVNRLPVLLLPGDIFATRRVDPVLQQLEQPWSRDVSVNDAFKPVSRYWDRINRPEQLPGALLEAMRVLTDQAETGAATIALPQDVQGEAWDFPVELFARRVWRITRPRPDEASLAQAARLIASARRPLVVAGGGVAYSEAGNALQRLVDATGLPVAETQAGKGALPFDHPCALGAMGVSGTRGANLIARDADVVIGIGTRWTDFATASRTAFQNSDVAFINVNVASMDACKLGGLPVLADARAALEALTDALHGCRVDEAYAAEILRHNREWDEEVERIFNRGHQPLASQGEVIGAVNASSTARDVVVCAAGSLPGDLHKLWRTRDSKGYQLEYGYSCMGYEIAGGLGAKMADPSREVYVMVGDGSWLMMPSEVVTSLQEGLKLIVVLVDNHGFGSIGALSRTCGSGGFGTEFRTRGPDGQLSGGVLEVDLVAHARALGARAVRAHTVEELQGALADARHADGTTVIVVETDPLAAVGSFESWWDVPVAEVSSMPTVQAARERYDAAQSGERAFVRPAPSPNVSPESGTGSRAVVAT